MNSALKSTRGISTLSLIILVLISGTIGAILSYLWTVGYFVELGLTVPEGVTTITITNVTFSRENSNYFTVTVMNPSYSESDARISNIAIIVTINNTKTVSYVDSVEPLTPYPLKKGENKTFKCNKNWGEYAGQSIIVTVLVERGSGATTSYETELVKLEIITFVFNTTITISQFNITIRNPSNMSLDVSEIRLGAELIAAEKISVDNQSITFPYTIPANESKILVCNWKLWDAETNSGYLGGTNNIVIRTVQGYRATYSQIFSDPVLLTVSNVTYPQLNATQFILRNDPLSPHHINIRNITLSVGNETFAVDTNLTAEYMIEQGINVTILCEDSRLNWDNWRGEKITIKVYTTQGFMAKREETIPTS